MSQQKAALTPKVFLTTLQTLHLTFSIAPLFLCVMAYLRANDKYLNMWDESNPFFLIVPTIAIGGLYAGNFIFKKKLTELDAVASLRSKLTGYQTASIFKWALLEAPALFSMVAFIQSGNQMFLIITVVLVGYLLTQRPTKDKVIEHLNLDMQAQSELNQPNKILE